MQLTHHFTVWKAAAGSELGNQKTGGGGCLLPGDVCTNTKQPVADVLWEKQLNIRVPPVENPTCTVFEEYKEVLETVPIDFS